MAHFMVTPILWGNFGGDETTSSGKRLTSVDADAEDDLLGKVHKRWGGRWLDGLDVLSETNVDKP